MFPKNKHVDIYLVNTFIKKSGSEKNLKTQRININDSIHFIENCDRSP